MNRILTATPAAAAALGDWITDAERVAAADFGSERRRREYLTWRALVRRATDRGVRIAYDINGAPYLPELPLRISVSHCAERVVIAISGMPCAVDVESVVRDFSRVRSRYLTSCESLLSADPRWPAVAWCAKETLYKYARCRELDLCRDLRLVGADLIGGRVVGRIGDGPLLTMRIDASEEHLIVSIFGDSDAPVTVEHLCF